MKAAFHPIECVADWYIIMNDYENPSCDSRARISEHAAARFRTHIGIGQARGEGATPDQAGRLRAGEAGVSLRSISGQVGENPMETFAAEHHHRMVGIARGSFQFEMIFMKAFLTEIKTS
jgi:hypothetical protein